MSRRVLVLGCLGTIAFLVAVALAGAARGLALYGYVLFLGALGLVLIGRGIGSAGPPVQPLERLLRRPPERDDRVPQLETLARRLASGRATAFDVHRRLRPLVVEIAGARLSRRHGVDLARQPAAAESLLGDRVWELVRPEREPPEDRFARGWSEQELGELVDELERI